MSTLIVPAPKLDFEAVSAGVAVLEKLIQVSCPPVKFSTGTIFTTSNLGTGGFFIYRQQTAAAQLDVWSDDVKQWEPDPGILPGTLKPKPFAFKTNGSWQGVLIAAGQKDKNGADQFQAASPNFPYYFVRAYFAGSDNGTPASTLSGPSALLRFVSMSDSIRAGIRLDGKPEDATQVEFFLRGPNRQIIGSIEIKSVGGNFAQIRVVNRDAAGNQGASLSILANGDVEITPAPGRSIIFSGPASTEQIFYQPADASGAATGPKKWLA